MRIKPCEFSAVIGKIGINPYVSVPERVTTRLKKRGYIPVSGSLNGIPIRSTLVPVKGGQHRLYVNGEMRKKAQVDVGDEIRLSLTFDEEKREIKMPEEFTLALQKNEKAKAAFERLPPSRQREILAYLNFLKKPESLKRNIDKVITILTRKVKKK